MPAVGFKGASHAQCRKVRKTFERPLAAPARAETAGAGRLRPARSIRGKSLSGAWIAPAPNGDLTYRPQRAGAGASSNDGSGLTPRPARSDGLDNVDGGPDAAFYIQLGVI